MRIEFPLRVAETELGPLLDPSIEIPVRTRLGFVPLRFIVDSGADVTMLPHSWAEEMNVSIAGEVERHVSGISGSHIPAHAGDIRIRIGEMELDLPCLFAVGENTPYLLGRLGLFDRFDVLFENRHQRVVFESIEPVPRTRPRIT